MHGKRFISAIIRLWLAAMAASAVLSCDKNSVEGGTGSQGKPDFNANSEVTVEFNILSPDSLPTTKTDRPDPDGTGPQDGWTEYPGSDPESVINSIHLFAVDYDKGTGTETVEDVVKVDLSPVDFTATGVKTVHTFKLSSGTKRFYAGANMTEAHVKALCNKEIMRADSYDSALAMVMDNYDNSEGNGTDILMLSEPAEDNATSEYDIDVSGIRVLEITARLKRLVSKVMVVAAYDGSKESPVGRPGETIPYIETAQGFFFDFHFILNTTNMTLDIQEKRENPGDLFDMDANWNLEDWVINDPVKGLILNQESNYAENFCSWSDSDLKARLGSTNQWYCSSVPSSSSSYLGQGLYCLENTVNAYNWSGDDAQKEQAAYLTTTHLYLKMRFAPKTVYGVFNPGTNESNDRISHLYSNCDKNGNNPYTFYIKNGSAPAEFYTTEGIQKWGENDFGKFTEYTGGWVYFKTFFEEGGMDDQDNKISHKDLTQWGIRRNDYCILTIKDIVNWGELTPGEAFIKVKSETTPWIKKGRSEIEITPE